MLKTIETFFLQNENLQGSKISVAVSGGSDSVALFFALHALSKQFSLLLSIAHLNYHLRGDESIGDSLFVQRLAERFDVPFYSRNAPLSIDESGIEEKARILRYEFFEELRRTGECEFIAVGHTREDQAETVLFRLIRGTSLHGISGMESVRLNGIVRPLLNLSRKECQQWLSDLKETWREDSSNATDEYSRNVIRHKIMPVLTELNSSAIEHIVAFADHARVLQADLVNRGMQKLHLRSLYESKELIHFQRSLAISSEEEAAIVELLRIRGCSITSYHVTKISSVCDRSGKTELLPGGWRMYSSWKRVLFYHVGSDPFTLNSALENRLYSFSDSVESTSVRMISDDDELLVNGSLKKLIAHLKKKGVPERERKAVPVADFDGEILLPEFL